MALQIEQRQYDGIPLMELTGRITDQDARDLSLALRRIDKKSPARIILDISRVNFIDSHGLGVIVYFSTLLDRQGRRFTILNTNAAPTAYINRLFQITNLTRVLELVNSKQALGS